MDETEQVLFIPDLCISPMPNHFDFPEREWEMLDLHLPLMKNEYQAKRPINR